MTRSGLTLLETLISIALLSAIAASVATWTQVAGRSAVDHLPQHQWNAAARATLRLVADDLLIMDFEPADKQPKATLTRVQVEPSQLEIKTRRPGIGAVTVRYSFDAFSKKLLVQEGASGAAAPAHRIVLDQLANFDSVLDEQERFLIITLQAVDGTALARKYLLR